MVLMLISFRLTFFIFSFFHFYIITVCFIDFLFTLMFLMTVCFEDNDLSRSYVL